MRLIRTHAQLFFPLYEVLGVPHKDPPGSAPDRGPLFINVVILFFRHMM